MLKIENFEVVCWEHAIRGMRNPKNSWAKSDSCTKGSWYCSEYCGNTECKSEIGISIGPNDYDLMMSLAKGGPVHAKYRRMITVYLDITAPLYWWKEFDTYKVGTVANSCSTMHKIHAKEFTLEDFSHEHLWGAWDIDVPEHEADTDCWIEGEYCETLLPFDILEKTIAMLNKARELFLRVKDKPMKDESRRAWLMKKYWWQMIQLLPSSYNQKRTVMLNYEVLHNIYESRRHHKLDEWHVICDWIEGLPYSEIITGKFEDSEN
jgi:hypothetical protein